MMNINWLKDPKNIVKMDVSDFIEMFKRELASVNLAGKIEEFLNNPEPEGKMVLAGNRISMRIFKPNLLFDELLENGDDIWVSFGMNRPYFCLTGTSQQNDKACFFFSHKNCEYFPCHNTDDPDSFNCLFCYCPLYCLGDRCGGNFSYAGTVKDCSDCSVPHQKNSYEYIIRRVREIPMQTTSTLTPNTDQ
jgi:Zn-finger protein